MGFGHEQALRWNFIRTRYQRIRIVPWLQQVCWAGDTHGAAIEHMGVDHRGLQVAVAQEFLNGAYVLASFEQMGGPDGVQLASIKQSPQLQHQP